MTKHLYAALLLGLFLAPTSFAENLILMNGSVADGSGKPRAVTNVRIRDGKIADIGPVKPTAGETVLDVKGLIVAPGFVDFEHVSPSNVQDGSAAMLITQGVTTAVVGADGSGPYLVEEFMQPFDEKPPALNFAMLVGHATVRRQIMGPDYQRAASPDEIQRMSELVSDAMKQGAFGLASDLRSEPASFSAPDELLVLAKTAATLGGMIVLNLRDENKNLSGAVKEAIAIAREAKTPVEVLTTNKTALAQIQTARTPRINIGADAYSFSQLAGDAGVSLERRIQRLTTTPASRLGLRERGVLKKGAPADIVIFDARALSAGMKYVFVNGILTLKDGRLTDSHGGSALR